MVLPARVFVVLVVGGVALYDLATGLRLAFGAEPFGVNGPDTIWAAAATELVPGSVAYEAAESMLRRLGAFTLLAATTSLVWLGFGWRDRKLLTALLAVYTIVGPAFSVVDARWFSGTDYYTIKQGITVAWVLALVAHAGVGWSRPAAVQPQPGVR